MLEQLVKTDTKHFDVW